MRLSKQNAQPGTRMLQSVPWPMVGAFMRFINRHSFLLVGAMAVALVSLMAARLGFSALSLGLVVAVIIGFTLLFRGLGAGRSSHSRPQPVLAAIGGGTPVLLMFQSAY
jgi:hypothetical protein